jgi:hypothetical protein
MFRILISHRRIATIAVMMLAAGSTWRALDAQGPRFEFTTIDFPDAAATTPLGINTRGDIVGTYRDSGGKIRGFVRRGDKFQAVEYPGAEYTLARGAGPAGEVVGAYRMPGEPAANLHGFLLAAKGGFTKVDYPGHTSTVPLRLLQDGSMIGCYHDADQLDTMYGMRISGKEHTGYERATTMHTGSTPDGKLIVGFYTDRPVTPIGTPVPSVGHDGHGHGYVLEGTRFTSFDVPGSTVTQPQDVSPSAVIVGNFQDGAGKTHGFVREGTTYTTVDVPNSTETRIFGINRSGVVVGSFVDAGKASHGFVGRSAR